jgi:hypothetical protein
LCYWTDIDPQDETCLRGYDTASGTPYSLDSGTGLYNNCKGGWVDLGGGVDGVYAAFNKENDGTVAGNLVQGSTPLRQDTLGLPQNGGTVIPHALAYTTPQNGLTVLAAQEQPTLLVSSAAEFATPPMFTELGQEAWAYPDCGAADTVPGEILLGSLYNRPDNGESDLILNRFPPGHAAWEHVGTISHVCQGCMAYNPKANQTMLLCVSEDRLTLQARLWNGTNWDPPQTVYAGTAQINEAVVRTRPDGEWGALWDAFDNTLRLAQTASGAWQAPLTVSTAPIVFPEGSLDLQFNPNGDAGMAVERQGGSAGIYYGYLPQGGSSATWQLAGVSKAESASFVNSLEVHWLPSASTPLVTYNVNALLTGSGLCALSKSGGTWGTTFLPFYLTGFPLGTAQDAAGTIAFAGRDNSSGQGTVCFLDW